MLRSPLVARENLNRKDWSRIFADCLAKSRLVRTQTMPALSLILRVKRWPVDILALDRLPQ
jgi:hypothetical protein